MNLKECYEILGGDYDTIINRLRKEEIIVKMLRMFAEDDTMSNLNSMLDAGHYRDAFLLAHNMKGMCFNLGISRLGESASDLTECIRSGTPVCDVTPLLKKVREDYELTISTIAGLDV